MRLAELLPFVEALDVFGTDVDDVDVRAITRDSREAGAGVIFVAIAGGRHDGHDYVDAVQAGVVVVERGVAVQPGVVRIHVADTRLALAQLSAGLYGQPAEQLPVVGITGTNGKTTIVSACEGAMRALGRSGGRIGTLGAVWKEEVRATGLTTPEAPELHRTLADMRAAGVEAAFVEVSSIALDQRRVDALPFHAVVFTNLSRDHLDFHGDMESYAAAKAQLFEASRLRAAGRGVRAVLCGDDPAWARMKPPEDRWLYGFEAHNDVRIVDLSLSDRGQRLRVVVPDQVEPIEVETQLVGRFNALNAVGALCALRLSGLRWEEAARGLSEVAGVPGRLQRVPVDQERGPCVFVDYAHTPDALAAALQALRPLVPAEQVLTVVFGCGGDRDAGKRPEMGRVAVAHADRVILTSDNPRTEDPEAILDAIEAGLPASPGVQVDRLADRHRAIAAAIATRGVVLIAGKGHEDYQEIHGNKLHFDDVEVAAQALSEPAAAPGVFGAAELARATGGSVLAAPKAPHALRGTVLTDTRVDLGGAWFLAIAGDRFDGHRYLDAAAERGAIGAVVSRIPEGFDLQAWGRGLVLVDDTLAAMADLGRAVARCVHRPIVGITGSSGKTTTRALTACALSGGGLQVHQTVGNLNNHLGVPMTLLATPAEAEVLVVEMGTSGPGEIEHLAKIGLPTHRVIVNVGPAHLLELGGLDGVAVEKGALFGTARPGDVLLVNLDDPRVADWVVRHPGGSSVMTWGQHPDADIRLGSVQLDAEALTTTVLWRVAGHPTIVRAVLPAFGLHFATNATAALATAVGLGLDPDACAEGLETYEPVGMRQRMERVEGGALALNDAYNANPASVRTALDTLAAMGGLGIAALGDMLELGEHEHSLHREVLEHATGLGLARILVVGPAMRRAAVGLDVEVFDDPTLAGEALRGHLTPEHRLLVKGSRGMAMERILQVLQAER